MDKFVHAGTLLGQNKLSKSDIAFLQFTVVERPQVFGNAAFGRLKEAVKARLQAEQASGQMPPEFQGMAGEDLLKSVMSMYNQGRGEILEGSVVYHMMMHLLQKLSGAPHPQTSTKLFALARALKHLHKPSYDFLRLNTLVQQYTQKEGSIDASVHLSLSLYIYM